jgi:hypothetical protein
MITVKPEVVIDYTHNGSSSTFASLTSKTVSRARGFTTTTFCEPPHQKTKSRAAHPNRVFLVAKSLGKFIILDVSGEKKCR